MGASGGSSGLGRMFYARWPAAEQPGRSGAGWHAATTCRHIVGPAHGSVRACRAVGDSCATGFGCNDRAWKGGAKVSLFFYWQMAVSFFSSAGGFLLTLSDAIALAFKDGDIGV